MNKEEYIPVKYKIQELPVHPHFKNLKGNTYGRLKVVGYFGKTKDIHSWICVCNCIEKNEVIVKASLLGTKTNSCGCLQKESRKLNKTHGLSKTREYSIWCGMKDRCYNENNERYSYYGGRGIKICDRWLESFENFVKDMPPIPGPKYSIDRINNDGNYEKGNCRWATAKQQANNKSNNHLLTYKGQTKNVQEWAGFLGINRLTIKSRIKMGWTDEEILCIPVGVSREEYHKSKL